METEQDTTGSEPTVNGPLQPLSEFGDVTDRLVVDPGTDSTDGASNAPSRNASGIKALQAPPASKSQDEETASETKHELQPPTIPGPTLVLETKAQTHESQHVLTSGEKHPITEGKTLTEITPNTVGERPSRPPLTTAPVTTKPEGSHVTNEAFEDFINSPRGQNAIVERSPEGRYVRFMEKLGSGASKDVYRAYDTTEGIEVAWNVVQLSGVPKAERNRIVNEVRLLERLHHPNIISFHGSWVNRERQEVNFVTEILSSGTLTSFIEKVQVIRWKIAKRWAFQILKGLEYLHSQDPPVIHRDLKCENIFINGTSGDLRIGDLGLSTVHRNGKVLSVLGTPEFMAPDLYEESAYDEKVDVYAFGMCLLEILTKEIPYRECSNPAQIYKKVMNGEKPESLSRLRSKIARDFIVLCLGEKNPVTGKYDRPSVTELLTNQFLAKSEDDDSEVIVDPPMQRRTILEDPGSMRSQATSASLEDRSVDEQVPMPASRRKDESPVEDDSDQFEEMPDSETNIRRVKVLMGRNEEFKEENHVVAKQPLPLQPVLNDTDNAAPPEKPLESSRASAPGPPAPQQVVGLLPIDEQSSVSQALIFAATVIEDQAAAMPHYQDELLKLIITLPVQGQTQNVQFNFHLVEDDPVEVAKEMVAELGIPQDAVLEIGGTISALARQARMKQGNYRRQQQTLAVAMQGNPPAIIPAVLVTETQPPQQVYPPHNSAQGLQPLQAVAVHGQITAAVAVPAQLSIPRPLPPSVVQPRLPLAPQHVQPHKPGSSLEQMQVPHQNSNPPSTNVSPMPHHIPRKVGVAPDFHTVVSDLTLQDPVTHGVESNALRAIDTVFGLERKENGNDDEDSVSEELKRLDEDFQKNIVRAQKVFDSRMDNLHRSKQEKEEQHKKTLQKHEKEKIEFEKRLQQEEIEQSLRLEKMQREWEIQRQNLEKAKRKAANANPEDTSLQEGPGKGVTGGPLSRSSSQESMTQNLGNTGNLAPTVPISMAASQAKQSAPSTESIGTGGYQEAPYYF